MTTVLVTNISPEQTREEINRFFSFCGKTQSIDIEEGETLTAKVTYETSQAFKTALLLNNSQFGATRITVADASGRSIEDTSEDVHHDTNTSAHDSDEISQEDKPRSRILAEYLAHGYVVGDAAVTRALELDEKHGVSARFLGTLQRLDSKYRASDKARAAATTTGQQTSGLWGGLSSYFEKASNTATGQKIVQFYTAGSRQVADVHNEALRLAELKKEEAGGSAVKAAGLVRVLGLDKSAVSADAETTAEAQTTGSTIGTTSAPAIQTTTNIPAAQPLSDAKLQ